MNQSLSELEHFTRIVLDGGGKAFRNLVHFLWKVLELQNASKFCAGIFRLWAGKDRCELICVGLLLDPCEVNLLEQEDSTKRIVLFFLSLAVDADKAITETY